MRQTFSFPFDDIDITSVKSAEETLPAGVHGLAFVQVGLWEVRRRWLSGQIHNLDELLANLDQDVQRLAHAIAEEAPELTATT